MNDKVKKEVKYLIKHLELFCGIEGFKDEKAVDWDWISAAYDLSEDFIREFQDQVDWGFISINQKMSEKFIREFQNKIRWDYIITQESLSNNFIAEFKDRLNLKSLLRNEKITQEFYNYLHKKVKRYEILDI